MRFDQFPRGFVNPLHAGLIALPGLDQEQGVFVNLAGLPLGENANLYQCRNQRCDKRRRYKLGGGDGVDWI